MNTGCPRQGIRDTALQLLQLLDKRFFGCVVPLPENDLGKLVHYFYLVLALTCDLYCTKGIFSKEFISRSWLIWIRLPVKKERTRVNELLY